MLGIFLWKKKIRLGNLFFLFIQYNLLMKKNVLNLLIHDHNCLIIYHCRIILAFIIMQMCTKAKESYTAFVLCLLC